MIQLSKSIWGPDAREFNPDRWFAPEIKEQQKCFMPVRTPYILLLSSLTMTVGPRMGILPRPAACQGANVQDYRYVCAPFVYLHCQCLTCSSIVRDYDLRQVDPNHEWTWAAYFTLNPQDWPVYVTKSVE